MTTDDRRYTYHEALEHASGLYPSAAIEIERRVYNQEDWWLISVFDVSGPYRPRADLRLMTQMRLRRRNPVEEPYVPPFLGGRVDAPEKEEAGVSPPGAEDVRGPESIEAVDHALGTTQEPDSNAERRWYRKKNPSS